MLFLIFHLSCCTHRGICEKFGSASQWYLSAPPVKIKWMNHAHRLCLRHGCLWLPSNFTTCFPVSAKFDRGANTFQDTKFSQVLENRHPHRRNWQCNYRKGSRTSSALTRPETTFHWVYSSWRYLIQWQNVSLHEWWEVHPVLSFLHGHHQQGQAHTFHSQRYPTQFQNGKCKNICSC